MNIRKSKTVVFGILMLGLSLGALAQDDKLFDNPGYLNLDELIENNEAYITSEVYLQSYILKMVAKVAQKSEPDFAKMLSSIHLIRVMEFEFDESGENSNKAVAEKLMRQLSSNHWDTLIRNRDDDQNVSICIQSDREDHIYALAIVSAENSKLSIVNVVGDIDLEMLARLGEQFNIDSLEDFEKDADTYE
jgi:hypothetical protein